MKTLKDHKTRLLLRPFDMSATPMGQVMAAQTAFLAHLSKSGIPQSAVPEHEALWFYATNHACAALAQKLDECEPLGDYAAVFEDYHGKMQISLLRMFYYLLMICTRESRHTHNPEGNLYPKYPDLKGYHQGYKATNKDVALKALSKIGETHPNMTLGRYTQFLLDSFQLCHFSSSYGGKKWADIAVVLKQFVHGEITGEMMLDTAWTLSHNCGPIFNKGVWYSMYDDDALREILDVQRAGMIPRLILDATGPGAVLFESRKHVTAPMREYVQKMGKHSADFVGSVDWQQVMALGSVGSYQNFVGKAVVKTMNKVEQFKEKLAAKKAAEYAAWVKANSVFIDTTLTVTKTTPTRVLA